MNATLPLAGDGRLISLPSLALWWSFARHRCDTFAEATRHQYRPPFSLVNGRLQNSRSRETWSVLSNPGPELGTERLSTRFRPTVDPPNASRPHAETEARPRVTPGSDRQSARRRPKPRG